MPPETRDPRRESVPLTRPSLVPPSAEQSPPIVRSPPPAALSATGTLARHARLRGAKIYCKLRWLYSGLNQRFSTLFPQEPSQSNPTRLCFVFIADVPRVPSRKLRVSKASMFVLDRALDKKPPSLPPRLPSQFNGGCSPARHHHLSAGGAATCLSALSSRLRSPVATEATVCRSALAGVSGLASLSAARGSHARLRRRAARAQRASSR